MLSALPRVVVFHSAGDRWRVVNEIVGASVRCSSWREAVDLARAEADLFATSFVVTWEEAGLRATGAA